MKKLVLAVLGVSVLAGAILYLNRPRVVPVAPSEAAVEPVTARPSDLPSKTVPTLVSHELSNSPSLEPAPTRQGTEPNAASSKAGMEAAMLNQAIDILVSSQATYAEKQTAWKHLRDAGKFDQTITGLEQRMAADPRSAEYPAALGQAYLKKCETIQDVREQGILAMQADKVFDTALNLDPSNWEARFTKAVALSYWPPNMNKGDEVIQHFQTLIQQQESQAQQPQFAESYVWLGDQYQKSGQSDDARTVWERGAGLFPNHDGLKNKLVAMTAPQLSKSTGGQ